MQGASQQLMSTVLSSQVMLVDDHPLFRAGLAQLLAFQPDLRVVADVGTPAEAVEIASRDLIDIAVLDVLMPTTSGVSLAAQLLDVRPACKLLALSAIDEPAMIAAMLRSGASGYAIKTQNPHEIINAIRTVLAGEHYLPPSVSRDQVMARVHGDGEPLQRLTRREREIFDLLIRGHSNDDIGTRLFIARRTVETHRQRIMKKLATHSIVEMIRLAARQGALAE
jgi:two-component system, NarL family, response regulator FusR